MSRWDYCSLPICTNDDEQKEDGNWCTHEGVDLKWQLYSAGERKEKGYVSEPLFMPIAKNNFFI